MRGRASAVSIPGYAQLLCSVSMLDLRLYRAALVPVLLALIVVRVLAPGPPAGRRHDARARRLRRRRATRDARGRSPRRFPRAPRRGRRGDAAPRRRVADAAARAASRLQRVHARRFKGETIDGERTLTTVDRPSGRGARAGASSSSPTATPPQPGSAAELSGTAALLELGRVFAGGATAAHAHARLDERRQRRRRRARATAAERLGAARSTRCSCSATSRQPRVRQPVVAVVQRAAGSRRCACSARSQRRVREEAGRDAGGPRARGRSSRGWPSR